MSSNRRRLSAAERHFVYDKMGGHCAYCGRKLEYGEMQVDHVVPINGWEKQGSDTVDNMFPACRSCNHYKGRSTLEGFRKAIEKQPAVLARDSVTYQIAVRFHLVRPTPHKITFYFEKIGVKLKEG